MSRSVTTAPTHSSLWTGTESVLRQMLRSFTMTDAEAATYDQIAHEQARIRHMGRHWLIG